MKQCPVCRSLAFDDATTCFGCLHEFSDESLNAMEAVAPEHDQQSVVVESPPAFLIQIKPERERSGQTSWICTVDLLPT